MVKENEDARDEFDSYLILLFPLSRLLVSMEYPSWIFELEISHNWQVGILPVRPDSRICRHITKQQPKGVLWYLKLIQNLRFSPMGLLQSCTCVG